MKKIKFIFLMFMMASCSRLYASLPPVDVLHYDLNCEIQLAQKQLDCKTAVKLQNNGEHVKKLSFYFELPAKILAVSMDKKAVSYTTNEHGTDVALSLEKELQPSGQKEILFTYVIPSTHIEKDKGFSLYNFMPENALSGGQKESFTATLNLKILKGYDVVAIGGFSGKKDDGENTIWTWDAKRSYQEILVLVNKFQEKTIMAGDVPITAYLTKNFSRADDILQRAKEAITFHSQVFSPYPYEKLSLVEVNEKDIPRRAMAFVSFVLLSSPAIENLHDDSSLLPHEISHQWWGSLVPLGFFSETWLTEGFATYSECLFMGKKKNAPCFEEERESDVGMIGLEWDKPVIYGYLSHGGTTAYGKGAWVLKMLQSVLGDDKFFQMLHEYIAKFTGIIPKNRDLRKLAEKYYGGKLDWFFKEWLEGTGAMDVDFSNVKVASKDGGYVTEGDLVQKTLFVMPVKIKMTTAAYDETVTVMLKGEKQHFSFTSTLSPLKLEIDPEKELLLVERHEHIFVDTAK